MPIYITMTMIIIKCRYKEQSLYKRISEVIRTNDHVVAKEMH